VSQAYPVRGDLYYDRDTHVWVAPVVGGRALIGLDPIGAETSGDLVAMSLAPDGARVTRGDAFGSIEAAKFVGPLVAPVGGVVRRQNQAALADPGVVQRAPYDTWLLEIEIEDPGELDELLTGEAEVQAWFDEEIARYRTRGMLAR